MGKIKHGSLADTPALDWVNGFLTTQIPRTKRLEMSKTPMQLHQMLSTLPSYYLNAFGLYFENCAVQSFCFYCWVCNVRLSWWGLLVSLNPLVFQVLNPLFLQVLNPLVLQASVL